MSVAQLHFSKEKLAEFCKQHHVSKLSLFGSALSSDFTPASDVDILVEFEPSHVPGLIRFAAIELELSAIFGRKVDLRTPQDLSRYFRDQVLTTASVQYAQ